MAWQARPRQGIKCSYVEASLHVKSKVGHREARDRRRKVVWLGNVEEGKSSERGSNGKETGVEGWLLRKKRVINAPTRGAEPFLVLKLVLRGSIFESLHDHKTIFRLGCWYHFQTVLRELRVSWASRQWAKQDGLFVIPFPGIYCYHFSCKWLHLFYYALWE